MGSELTDVESFLPIVPSFFWDEEGLSRACFSEGLATSRRLYVEVAVLLAANEPEMSAKSATPDWGLYDLCVFNWGSFGTLNELYVRLGPDRSSSSYTFLDREDPNALGCTPDWKKPFCDVPPGGSIGNPDTLSSCRSYFSLMLLGFACARHFCPTITWRTRENC